MLPATDTVYTYLQAFYTQNYFPTYQLTSLLLVGATHFGSARQCLKLVSLSCALPIPDLETTHCLL